MATMTVLTPTSTHEVSAEVDAAAVLVSGDELPELLGWELKPEGLCRDDVCVPTPPDVGVRHDDRIDLVATAGLLGCTTEVDAEGGALAISVAADRRRAALAGREAPDFVLPDLDGQLHSLGAFRDLKRLLVAFASW